MGGMMGKDVDIGPLVRLGREWLGFSKDVYGYGKKQYETFAVPQLEEMKRIVSGNYSSPLASKMMAAPTQAATQAAEQAKQQVLEGGLGPVQTQRLLSTIDTERVKDLSTQAMSMIDNMLQSLLTGGQFAYQTGTQGAVGFGQIGSNMLQTAYTLQAQAQMQQNKMLADSIGSIVSLGTFITGPMGLGLWGAAK
jgi:hypothetical protein